jgi:hypothetical protein
MNREIEAIVKQYPMLTLQVNKGKKYRIMRSDIRRGSLWVEPRIKAYSINPTGEVASLLDHFLRSKFGPETREDHKGRWKYWKISDVADVSRIIRHFGER